MYNPYYLPQQQVQKIAGEQSARSVWLCVSDVSVLSTPCPYAMV